jgi:uncharacterized Zn finger protein
MERLAAGDVDRLVAIKSRTAKHGWDYLQIATLLRDAGRLEEAIDWAERGLAAGRDGRLREFLAHCQHEAGYPEAALAQRAAQFREQPTLAAYRALHAEAEPLGAWPRERAAAMAALEQPSRASWPRDHSVLVAILLWEGDVARAWEQALAGGCSRDLWRALARERPDDAVSIYRRHPRSTCATTTATTGRSSSWPSCTNCSHRSAGRPTTRHSSPRYAKFTAVRPT